MTDSVATVGVSALDAIEDATRAVRAVLPPTPQYRWPLLEQRTGAEVG